MSEIKIIQLIPKQWERYREIRLEALHEEPQAFGSTFAEMEHKPPDYWQGRLAEAAQGEKSRLLFAQQGERLVGIIGAFYDEAQEMATIVSVYVNKAERSQGVGKALMDGILSAIDQKKGIRKATLEVNQGQTAAVELYRRFGFVVTAEQEEVQGDGKSYRGYWMEKRIPLKPVQERRGFLKGLDTDIEREYL